MRLLLRTLLLTMLCLAPAAALAAEGDEAPATPRIYRWVDENGVAHYTTDEDRIPASLRRRFGLPTRPLENKPLEAGAREATPPPEAPAEPASAPDAWAAQERSAPPPGAGSAPAPSPEPLPDVAASASEDASRLAQIELRIAELSAAIAADEDALSAWIGDPDAGGAVETGEKPEFREIAKRLPKRIQELEALRSERDALEAAVR